MQTNLQAVDFGVSLSNPDNSNSLLDAMETALGMGLELLLPGGDLHCKSSISMRGTNPVQGKLACRGNGRRQTNIYFDNPIDGFDFDCSQGNPYENCVELSDFSIIGTDPKSGTGLKIDYGYTAFKNSCEDRSTSHLRNIEMRGWRDGINAINLWNAVFDGLLVSGGASYNGSSKTSTVGTGSAITMNGGVNWQVNNLKITWYNLGLALLSNNAVLQGIFINNYTTVEALSAIINNSQPKDGFGTLKVANFCFDNGNKQDAKHANVVLQNAVDVGFSNGTMLQNGGNEQVKFSNCQRAKLLGVDFVGQLNLLRSVYLDGTTTQGIISGCTFGTPPATLLGAQTTNNLVRGNRYDVGGNVDLGKKNSVEEPGTNK